jgi:hypothetical protein
LKRSFTLITNIVIVTVIYIVNTTNYHATTSNTTIPLLDVNALLQSAAVYRDMIPDMTPKAFDRHCARGGYTQQP